MELNRLIFKAPKHSDLRPEIRKKILWVTHQGKTIPCLYLNSQTQSNQIFLYFHARGEDIATVYPFAKQLQASLLANVLVVEYPGFSVYEGKPSAQRLCSDAETIYMFLTQQVGVQPQHIFVMGRSIGSGPAVHLAATVEIRCLILLSPFTSLRAAIRHIILGGRLLKTMVKDRFNNLAAIQRVKCPCFFLCGKKDKQLPLSHSLLLHEVCGGRSELHISKRMTHCQMDFIDDLFLPLIGFLKDIHYNSEQTGPLHVPLNPEYC